MKKLFLIVATLALLFASEAQTERKIYDAIIHALFLDQERTIHLWSDSDRLRDELQKLRDIKIVEDIDQADMAIITNKLPKECKCLLFVTSNRRLKEYKNKAVGGFFWQKGRPNILFLKANLHKLNIKLPESMKQFVEDEL